jgi:uncharacterized protein
VSHIPCAGRRPAGAPRHAPPAWRWPLRVLAAGILLLQAALLPAQELPVPALTGRVVDLTATLTASEQATLADRLEQLEAAQGSQVAVLFVPTTEPEAIEQFSIRVVDQWQLGRQGVDDGVLVLVAKDDRTVRIEVGRGLEGAIPDAIANRIIDEYVVPRFRSGDYAGGVTAAVDRIAQLIDGEPLPPPAAGWEGGGRPGAEAAFPIIFVLSLVAGGFLRRVFGQVPGALLTGGLAGGVAWLLVGALGVALFMAFVGFFIGLTGGGGGGPWVSRGGRRGGAGGFGGGGFGGRGGGFGGGGGGFGGGGASGRW